LLVVAAVALGSCGDDGTSGAGAGTGTGASGAGGHESVTLRLDPAQASVELVIGEPPPSLAFTALATRGTTAEEDVTSDTQFVVLKQSVGTFSGPTLTLSGIGGVTEVRGTYEGANAAAALTVSLRGDVVVPGADPTLPDQFEMAVPDPTPGSEPVLEYPEDGAVLPGNLPPIEAQYTQAADNSAYRVRLRVEGLLDVSFYTEARELLFPADVWSLVGQSVPDTPITITVDGLGAGGLVRTSAPRTMIISADRIEDSAIYVWQSSTGSFRVLDIANGTDVPLPTNAPALGPGQPCSGCHRISRDGKRFSYSFNGAGFEAGALRYDEASQTFLEVIAPVAGVRGTYATFNPLEETTIPAMLLTVPEDVPQNAPGTTRLSLVHPETLAPVPSNLSAALGGTLPSTLMPDWSPAGDFVVFVAYDSATYYVREIGDDIVLGSIVEVPVSYDPTAQSFTFGMPAVLVAPPPGSSPDTGENNFLPTVSPDGTAVAFTRAAGWWSLKTQADPINQSGQIMLVRRSDGHVFELVRGSNGPGTIMHSTWPQWAPGAGAKYAWVAYSSQRPYGHRLTPASPENAQCTLVQGQTQCKQLWVTAIDRAALANGTADPSQPAFWIPGQNLAAQYVSPQWTTAVLPPPR
jgi:hypothetical protein